MQPQLLADLPAPYVCRRQNPFFLAKAVITIAIRFYDKTTIRRIRRYHDALDYDGSDRNYDSTAIRLRHDIVN